MHRRRLNAGRTDELQERLVPLDDRIYGGRAAASARWGVAKPKAAATTVKATVAVNAKGLWRIILGQLRSGRGIGAYDRRFPAASAESDESCELLSSDS